jgi:hypothetical protein
VTAAESIGFRRLAGRDSTRDDPLIAGSISDAERAWMRSGHRSGFYRVSRYHFGMNSIFLVTRNPQKSASRPSDRQIDAQIIRAIERWENEGGKSPRVFGVEQNHDREKQRQL